MTQQFEHNGVKIGLLPSGQFSAEVKGQTVVAPSLAALKKKLGKIDAFQEFDALAIQYDRVKEFRVIGLGKDRRPRFYSSGRFWKCSDNVNRYEVHPDTPENRVALAALLKQQEEDLEENERRTEARRSMLAAIPTVRPGAAK